MQQKQQHDPKRLDPQLVRTCPFKQSDRPAAPLGLDTSLIVACTRDIFKVNRWPFDAQLADACCHEHHVKRYKCQEFFVIDSCIPVSMMPLIPCNGHLIKLKRKRLEAAAAEPEIYEDNM